MIGSFRNDPRGNILLLQLFSLETKPRSPIFVLNYYLSLEPSRMYIRVHQINIYSYGTL